MLPFTAHIMQFASMHMSCHMSHYFKKKKKKLSRIAAFSAHNTKKQQHHDRYHMNWKGGCDLFLLLTGLSLFANVSAFLI